ncbi:uncharacterized protein LOC144422757 [Styela clava]
MASSETISKNETSLREMISSFVRKPTKQQRRKQITEAEARKNRCTRKTTNIDSFCDCGHSDVGFWDNDISTDSFLELSSDVLPVEIDSMENGTYDGILVENGNLWKDEVRRKCSILTKNLEEKLKSSASEHGLALKFPIDLPHRLANKIVDTASSEPCGLRGCCVNLRLLHEDIAGVLMTSQVGEGPVFSDARLEKCASWPEEPRKKTNTHLSNAERPELDFRLLPDMDATLTERFSPDFSTDSGFADSAEFRRPMHRRLQHSLSSSAIPILPSLSAASRLQVACADLGCLDLCDSDSVPTFELYIYLAPVTSWSWWVRRLFSSSLKAGKGDCDAHRNKPNSNQKNLKSLNLMPDFTLVKRKLYRTRSNSLEVIRCPLPK